MRPKLLLRLAAASILGLLGVELGLRFLLFSPVAGPLGAPLRHAAYYAEADTDAHWILRARFDPEGRDRPRFPDPVLGWVSRSLTPVTYAHVDHTADDPRRRILLYGDSFAACMTPAEDCFQELVERSELGASQRLLNYGVPGYGLGQMGLLLEHTLPHHDGQETVVVIGIFLDDDLDRSGLCLRQFPKPRFFLEDGELGHSAPSTTSRSAWIADNPMATTSYAWRAIRTSDTRPRQPKARLNRAILAAMRDDLERHGTPGFVLLLPGRRTLEAGGEHDPWQVSFLRETLRELGLPFVEARAELEQEAARLAAGVDALFLRSGEGTGHYNALGNAAAFGALQRGLRGAYDG